MCVGLSTKTWGCCHIWEWNLCFHTDPRHPWKCLIPKTAALHIFNRIFMSVTLFLQASEIWTWPDADYFSTEFGGRLSEGLTSGSSLTNKFRWWAPAVMPSFYPLAGSVFFYLVIQQLLSVILHRWTTMAKLRCTWLSSLFMLPPQAAHSTDERSVLAVNRSSEPPCPFQSLQFFQYKGHIVFKILAKVWEKWMAHICGRSVAKRALGQAGLVVPSKGWRCIKHNPHSLPQSHPNLSAHHNSNRG